MSNFGARGNFARSGGGGGRGGTWGGPPKGTFLSGVWHCDCTPPLPAVHLQVKKETANKGRWFRSCQKPQQQRCKFFLWDSDAHARENAALANNSRTEPGHAATTPRAQRVPSPPPPYTPEAGPSEPNRKHGRASAQQEEDEYGFGDGDDDFEVQLNHAMVEAETPSKRPRTETDAFTTPSRPTRRKLPWQTDDTPIPNALPTPQTESRTSNFFPTRFAAPQGSLLTPSRHRSSDDSAIMTPGSSPNETPTPVRFKDVPPSDLVRDVFGLLSEANVQMNEQTRKNLTAVLSRHATIIEGVKKGRKVARASITAKIAKVTELTYRVSTLEAELEAEKAKVNHLKWSLEHGQPSE
ncbi:hypothetical protein BU23DRAFT_243681 [Bimuria novae-zelandiae CBS 107.79]|uniref:GRF-type domain-containing protein n=1 Tax=Bimuria novae-zelandiae CBS 107.79 TaxID=1447943 RepID=A0A6A5V754_9PLEO|nr:hypothetical protein BU23DRAFT_243681 [Bimuria novae-zelandiae CBS 107.79]